MRKAFMLAAIALAAILLATPADAQSSKKKKQKKGQKQEMPSIPQPALANAGDSTAYLFGLTQSKGLRQYATTQLGVDSAHLDQFVQGILDRVQADPSNPEQHAYLTGNDIGHQINQMTQSFAKDYYAASPGTQVNPEIVAAGILNGMLGYDTADPDSAMQQFRQVMTARQRENEALAWGGNKEEGLAFLAENKKQDGVITLPSGLQYRILKQGNGPIPTATDRVKVHYEGHLIDGTEFDSSYKRNEPSTFKANQVIKGWTEALCKMPVGSKWQLYIPYDLAYGERKTGKINPYSTLIFTVELLDIVNESNATGKSANAAAAKKKK